MHVKHLLPWHFKIATDRIVNEIVCRQALTF